MVARAHGAAVMNRDRDLPHGAGKEALVDIAGLTLRRDGVAVLDEVSFEIAPNETVGLVGESGAGKSTLALALAGLIGPPEVEIAGAMRFEGIDLTRLDDRGWRGLRGRRIAMIFQDAGAALNPCFTVGQHFRYPLRHGLGLGRRQARSRAIDLLQSVGLNDAEARLGAYPHELSGGMQQRVMIGLALAGEPDLLLADEPTSALDVTIQAQIVGLILARTRDSGSSCVFVLHDLALASQACQRIVVLYAGQVMEMGTSRTLLERPLHPYTQALRSCVAEFDTDLLEPPPGGSPSLSAMPAGCRFAPRCPRATERCRTDRPPLIESEGRSVACWHPG
ncbi:ABC transporter ATP-binding protein [Marinivivus vitaminiproducens]|uniref:ABC transporter ATP-binding protein n=1 Tax=Marinivivus vitaminiproducens TaxID=3035935 RepID=UPI0027A17CDB|nr:ABC transporter ATP-binding protein [Geminicoccaceae bacterium SCSIO 64248]